MIGLISFVAAAAKDRARLTLGWAINWALSDPRLKLESFTAEEGRIFDFKAGEHTMSLTGNKINSNTTVVPSALGDLAVNASSGIWSYYDGASARAFASAHLVLPLAGGTMTGAIAMGSNKVTGLAAGTAAGDAARFEQVIREDGTNDFTADQSMGGFKLTSVGTPTLTGDAATKAYVDSVASGLVWREPVVCIDLVGSETYANLEALGTGATTSDSYVCTSGGTLTEGSLLVAAGDVVEWNGSAWVKIVSNSGGFVPAGTRFVVNTVTTVQSPFTTSTDEGKIAEYDGTGNLIGDITLTAPSTSDAILVIGNPGDTQPVDDNRAYVFDGSVPTGSWIQFAGPGGDHNTLANLTVGDDHTQYAKLDGSKARNTFDGAGILLDGAEIEGTNGGGVNMANGVLVCQTNAGTPTQTDNGDMVWDSTNNLFYVGDGTTRRQMVDTNSTQTMTNKTISGGSFVGAHTMTDDGTFLPDATGEGTLGSAAKKFKLVTAVTGNFSDVNMFHEGRETKLTLIENTRDGEAEMMVLDRVTGKAYKIPLVPADLPEGFAPTDGMPIVIGATWEFEQFAQAAK